MSAAVDDRPRRRMSPAQRAMAAVLTLLVAAGLGLNVLTISNLSRSTAEFRTSLDTITAAANVVRETLKLRVMTSDLRTADDVQSFVTRRQLLERQLSILRVAARENVAIATKLEGLTGELAKVDALLDQLAKDATPARIAASRPALTELLDATELQVKSTYDLCEQDFFGRMVHAANARTQYQWQLLGATGLTIFIAVLLFVSVRRRMNSSLADAYDALERSERRFKALVHHASDVITVVDAAGRITYQSPAVYAVLGREAEDLVGRSMLDLVVEDDRPAAVAMLERSAGTGTGMEPVVGEVRLEIGSERTGLFEMTMTNLLDDPSVGGIVLNYRDVTERANFQSRLEHQAYHDTLTGLPNRAMFQQRLDACVREGLDVAVLFIDLDRFKMVNDNMGHEAGDQLLMQVADRLRSCVRGEDLLARLGGDEFTVLVTGDAAGKARRLAERMLAILQEPFLVDEQVLFIDSSIGVSIGGAGSDADELLRDADSAMYVSKGGGGGRFGFFSPEHNERIAGRLRMETDLRNAIENGELILHYQPIRDLCGDRTVGVEALVRWLRDGTMVSPAEFVPLAEESGLIHPLGRWVLREACGQVVDWRRAGLVGDDFTVSVNLSARQFRDPSLVADVAGILVETGLPPYALVLELTETAIVADVAESAATLRELRAMSVGVALDDFGTGYSSLTHLRELPIDIVKIDRSFVRDLDTDDSQAAIVGTIVALAHRLRIHTTAEGIERSGEEEALRSLGCDTGQGYLLARPMPADQLALELMPRQRSA